MVKLPEVQRLNFLDFFAGSGLVTEGANPWFKTVWANDISAKKAAVYRVNHGDEHFHLRSITDVTGDTLPAADVSWGSFPCQDLSLAGKMQGLKAKRSGLVWEWLRVMDEMAQRPPVLCAENVLGLVSSDGGSNYRELHEALVARGYVVGPMVLDAIEWVPQSRPRVFVVAVRKDITFGKYAGEKPAWNHPVPVQRAAEGMKDLVWWKLPQPAACKQTLEDFIERRVDWHPEDKRASNIAMLSASHRQTLMGLPGKRITVPGYRRTRNGVPVLEVRFDGKSGCLRTAEGGSSRQIIVQREGDDLRTRWLSPREAARLMGAPDSYQLPSGYTEAYNAMGDAVAVPVVSHLAQHLLHPLALIAAHHETRKPPAKV